MLRRGFLCGAVVLYPLLAHVDLGTNDGATLAPIYAQQVDRWLDIPESQQRVYAELLAKNLAGEDEAQYVVIVDRNKFVQAAMIYWMSPDQVFHYIGASPVSTGKPGRFEHFITPTGVFEHTIANLDFLSEGTRNEFGIRGYGRKGMRVYDFGWQTGQKGWSGGGEGSLRLQMHATDPDLLEQKLGTPQSKGCIRIPATLNAFIDHYGILDGDYEKAMAAGLTFWVLSRTREATPWSGRFLVVVDTGRTERPAWSRPHSKGHGRQGVIRAPPRANPHGERCSEPDDQAHAQPTSLRRLWNGQKLAHARCLGRQLQISLMLYSSSDPCAFTSNSRIVWERFSVFLLNRRRRRESATIDTTFAVSGFAPMVLPTKYCIS